MLAWGIYDGPSRQAGAPNIPEPEHAPAGNPERAQQGNRAAHASKRPNFWRDLAIGVGLLTTLQPAATSAPSMPYNIRELIYQGSPILSALMLSLFWFWLAGVPVILATGLATSRTFRLLYLPTTLSHAAAAAVAHHHGCPGREHP